MSDEEDRSKIKGRPRQPKPKATPANKDVTAEILFSLTQQKSLGRMVQDWSRLENCLQGVVWTMSGLSIPDGKILTSTMDASSLIRALRSLGRLHLLTEHLRHFLSLMNALEDMRESRNLAVHGLWALTFPGGLTSVLSIRLKIEDNEGDVMSEEFSNQRLESLIKDIETCRQQIVALEIGITTSRDKWLISRP